MEEKEYLFGIALEAHTLGRIYNKMGEPETPAEVCKKLEEMIGLRSKLHAPQPIIEDWKEILSLFLSVGEDLMSVGTERNMTQDWYKMVEKKIDHGVDVAYRNIIQKST